MPARLISKCATFERIDSLLSYNPERGVFYWKVSPCKRLKIGSEAGCLNKRNGYIQIGVDGKIYLAHRIAHLLHEGRWPEGNPEHENRIKTDNRWENIKDLAKNQTENLGNQKLQSNSTSGLKGVSWNKQNRKWEAYIKFHKKTIHLGLFDDPHLAGLHYDAAAKIIWGLRFSCLNFQSWESNRVCPTMFLTS